MQRKAKSQQTKAQPQLKRATSPLDDDGVILVTALRQRNDITEVRVTGINWPLALFLIFALTLVVFFAAGHITGRLDRVLDSTERLLLGLLEVMRR